MADAPDDLDIREQIAPIDRMPADPARKRPEVTDQPRIFLVSGMTAGAALFAAGAAAFELLT